MVTYFKALLTDEGRFVSLARFLLGGMGAALIADPGLIQGLPPLVGAGLMAVAMALNSSAAKSE